MMQITVNPADMTQAQREAVAGFILAYPTHTSVNVNCEIPVSTELEQLQHEHVTTMPAAAFVPIYDELKTAQALDTRASIAFGSGPVPLPPGAIAPTFTPSSVVPPPPAPTAPISTTPGHVSSDVDVNGLPWDHRIHAESKAKIADGSWRSKRNLDPAIKATVEAELRQVMSALLAVPTVTTQVPAPPVTASSPITTASPPAAPVAPPATDARQVFVQLVGRCAAAIAAGKLTQAEVTECCTARGVPMLPLLANRLDLVADVAAAVDAIIASRA